MDGDVVQPGWRASSEDDQDPSQRQLDQLFDELGVNNERLLNGDAKFTGSSRYGPSTPPQRAREVRHRSAISQSRTAEEQEPSPCRGQYSTLSYNKHRRARTDLSGFSTTASLPSRGSQPSPLSIAQSNLDDVDLGLPKRGKINEPRSNRTNRLLSGLFQGDSTPIKRAFWATTPEKGPNSELNDPSGADSSSSTPTKFSMNMNVGASLKQVKSSNPFSFFTSKAQPHQKAALPEPAEDEFLNLDIDSTLFPAYLADLPPEEAASKFQIHAENLVRELQTAYKLRTFALHEALAEKQAQEEELGEAQSRVENIKHQLDGMAARVLEQDKAIGTLTEELRLQQQTQQHHDQYIPSEQFEVYGHQLAHPQSRHTKNFSAATIVSDSGFESGDESVAESVFSRENDDAASVTTRLSTVSLSNIPTSMRPPPLVLPPTKAASPKPQISPSRETAYGRVLKGISSSGIGSSINALTSSISRCPNCRANGSTDASTVTSNLREENRLLKRRILELEAAIDDCILLAGG
ncbi:hypothetical protein FQN57_004086 [Myotisia sp. PD_48]|nr:hypothetical protein FQN57_004086 [Myotisia sp. PD_48]